MGDGEIRNETSLPRVPRAPSSINVVNCFGGGGGSSGNNLKWIGLLGKYIGLSCKWFCRAIETEWEGAVSLIK